MILLCAKTEQMNHFAFVGNKNGSVQMKRNALMISKCVMEKQHVTANIAVMKMKIFATTYGVAPEED